MTTYLGPVGSLIEIKCPAELNISGGRAVSLTRTLSRQKAYRARAGFREWSAQLSPATTPGQVAGLAWLAEYGNPPFVWYPPDAVFGNILEPAAAGLVGGTHNGLEGPLVEVEPGVWVKSILANGTNAVSFPYRSGSLDHVPIVPGRMVTVSAWLGGGTLSEGSEAAISVIWRDVLGGSLGTVSTRFNASSGLVRRHVSLLPPEGAVALTLQFFGVRVAGPAVTLTDTLTSYAPGKGCKRVIAHGLSEALTMATTQASYSGFSFTVSEVG